MAYIRLPLGIRVAMEYEVFGKVVVNVYHVTTTDPIITIKLTTIAEAFRDWFISDLNIGLSPDIALTAVTAHNLNVANGEKITVVVSPPSPGIAVGDAVSNNVALVASLGTDLTGRSFRGRSYIAGITETNVTANEIGTAYAAFFVSSITFLMADLDSINTDLVIASFVSGGAPRAEGLPTLVTSVSMDVRVDTQRRRLPR